MQQTFSNFEVFSSVLKGYDIDMRQIDRGAFTGKLQQIQYGPVFINRVSATRRFEVFGNPPSGLRTFGIPGADCLPFNWRHKNSTGNTIQIYRPDTELEMITQSFFEAIDISITEDAFNLLLQQWDLPALDKLIAKREMVICRHEVMQLLRKTLQTICITTDKNPELLDHNTDLQDIITTDIPYLLSQALMQAETQDIITMPEKRNHALITAIDYIHATPSGKISLNSFCSEYDINERTLQRAFLEQYGITAKTYARTYRLNHVYRKLSSSETGAIRISKVAREHGFWHMSQFALDYQRHFGELPSETLRTR